MGMHNSLAVGIAAAFASVAIGAGWQVATRLGTTTSLQPVDLALLRYCIPAILLAPIWWRVRPIPANVDRRVLLAMLIGGGLPFGLLGMAGAQFAPVAHMGALLPGAMPLFVALLAAIVLGERFSVARLAGFMLILLGIAAIGARALLVRDDGAWRGDLLFLSAAFVWAIYTIAFRRSGMTPWQSSAIICLWSALFVMPLWLLSGPERVLAAPVADLVLQFIMQGIVAGVAGLWLYALAVAGIGPSRAAAIGALVPVLSAVGGAVLLGEFPDLPVMAGVVLTVCGVFLASGVLALRRAG